MELLVWPTENKNEINVLISFVNSSYIFGLSDAIVDRTIEIRRASKVKLPDSIIAATALVNGYALTADNDRDFLKVAGLKYINPKNI